MIVVGGRTNANDELSSTMEVYDTETSEWYRINTINRYRHTVVLMDSIMYIHGGFEP
jgi:protein phosphatase